MLIVLHCLQQTASKAKPPVCFYSNCFIQNSGQRGTEKEKIGKIRGKKIINWFIQFLLGGAFVRPCQQQVKPKRLHLRWPASIHWEENTYVDRNCVRLSCLYKIKFFPVHVAASQDSQSIATPRRHSARHQPHGCAFKQAEPPEEEHGLKMSRSVTAGETLGTQMSTVTYSSLLQVRISPGGYHIVLITSPHAASQNLSPITSQNELAPEGKAQQKLLQPGTFPCTLGT